MNTMTYSASCWFYCCSFCSSLVKGTHWNSWNSFIMAQRCKINTLTVPGGGGNSLRRLCLCTLTHSTKCYASHSNWRNYLLHTFQTHAVDTCSMTHGEACALSVPANNTVFACLITLYSVICIVSVLDGMSSDMQPSCTVDVPPPPQWRLYISVYKHVYVCM